MKIVFSLARIREVWLNAASATLKPIRHCVMYAIRRV